MSTLVSHSRRVQFRKTQVWCKELFFFFFYRGRITCKAGCFIFWPNVEYFSSSCVLANCFSTRSFVFLSSSVFLSFLSLCWSLSKAGLLGDWRRRESVINLINWFWDVNQMKPVPVGAWGQHGGVSLRWGFCWCRLPTMANGFSMFCKIYVKTGHLFLI